MGKIDPYNFQSKRQQPKERRREARFKAKQQDRSENPFGLSGKALAKMILRKKLR